MFGFILAGTLLLSWPETWSKKRPFIIHLPHVEQKHVLLCFNIVVLLTSVLQWAWSDLSIITMILS